jgi:prophage regulatory protein
MRFIRLKEVISMTGLGRSSIYKFMGEGHFPQSISLGERAIAWELGEIEEWISIKIEGRTNIDKGKSKESVTSPVTESDVISFINGKFSGCNISVVIAWLIGLFKQ